MITKTIKTLGLCMLILCSASIQAGSIHDRLVELLPKIVKEKWNNAETNHPNYLFGAITAAGGLAVYYSDPIAKQINKMLPSISFSSVGEPIIDYSRGSIFYKIEKRVIICGTATLLYGALNLFKRL